MLPRDVQTRQGEEGGEVFSSHQRGIIMRFPVVALVLAFVLLPAGWRVDAQNSNRPNIIFVMTDDHAAHAIGAY